MTTETLLPPLKHIPFEDVLSVIQDCITFPTLSGQEEKLVQHLIKVASRLGFTSAHNDRMGNLVAEMTVGTGEGPRIVISGHLDTVSANPAEWNATTKPFAGSIIDGRLYGRGSADMKGSFGVMLHAAASLQSLKAPFSGKVFVVGTVVEELFEGVCFLEALKDIKPDFVVIGEATGGKINIGQRGRAEIVITSFGQPQHASTGRKVINAIEQTAYIIDAFHVWYRSQADEILGRRNIVPTDIKIPLGGGGGIDGRGGNSTVPNKVEITYDIRTLAEDTEESIILLVRENIDQVVQNARIRYPQFRTPGIQYSSERSVTWTCEPIVQKKFAPAWKTDPDSDLVKKATAGFEKALGKTPEFGHYGFCTDGSGVVRYRDLFPEAKVDIIGYGPGSEEDAHTVNESVSLADLKDTYLGFQGILTELLKKE
ncbi:MAG: M20/M25/M40 family metallo-hydrolase [Candidatus Eremiobacteraeota bacterium]|nr:M20/M25/M40 family metallo-hydrolase [Candidatus Eremiobacteraeota bacterium]